MDKQNINNPEQKAILPKPIGCLIALIFLGIFFLIGRYFLYIGRMMYEDAPIRGKVIFRIFVALVVCFIIIEIKRSIALDKAVENGTAIRKKVKVIGFSFANKGGGRDDTSNGYYVVVSDGIDDYDGMFHRGARIIGKLDEDLKKDKFYKENGITLDLKNRDITRKQLDQRISELEQELSHTKFIKNVKLKMEIGELKNKKKDLEEYHLSSREGKFHIGDEYTILIDPDDPSNYIFEMDGV